MMKTIHTLWIALALTATCNFFTACSDDREPQWNPEISEGEDLPTVGDGQFVVNYGASDGTSTRALSNNTLPANKRISSLHYYVYDDDTKTLIKKRQIRGINEQTKWPIIWRSDMPWELRQDLQDTLMAGPTYRILFIANIDPKLFTKPDGSDHPAVVRNDENYETAQILLPEVPFSDNNMYYLWEGSLKAEAGKTVKRDDVMLRRLVTRTDVERKEIADLEKHLYNAIAKSLYNKPENENKLKGLMNTHVEAFAQRIDDRMNGDYEKEANQLRDLLRKPEIQDTLYKALKTTIAKRYTEAIVNSTLAAKIKEWSQTGTVTTDYQKGTRTNVLFFNKTVDMDATLKQTEDLELTGGTFTIIGFSGDEKKRMNGIDKLTFKIPGDNATFEISNATLWLKGGLNTRHKAICNPVVGITIENTAPKELIPTLNFTEALKNIPEWVELSNYQKSGMDKTLFEMVLDRVFKPNLSVQSWKYGPDFTLFQFTNFRIPNLTEANAHEHVTIIPSWTCE